MDTQWEGQKNAFRRKTPALPAPAVLCSDLAAGASASFTHLVLQVAGTLTHNHTPFTRV